MWIAICSVLACGFLIKGGARSELLWAIVIGAANGMAVGFAVGPAAEKGAMILSGLFAGTPVYFIAASICGERGATSFDLTDFRKSTCSLS